jgi:hypothetical protein
MYFKTIKIIYGKSLANITFKCKMMEHFPLKSGTGQLLVNIILKLIYPEQLNNKRNKSYSIYERK